MSEYTLFQGDCLEFMKSMPDKSVDAVITDPPYGIERFRRGSLRFDKKGEYPDGLKWDNKPEAVVFSEIIRIGKTAIIWGSNNFSLPQSECFLVWDKFQTVDNFASAELAFCNKDNLTAKVFRYPIHKHNQTEKFHPTQKPIELMKWCIELTTKIGDVVFDPFMGSGTTGIAALQLGRKFIGCELSPEYFAIAEKRIKSAAAQPILFTSGVTEPSQDVEQLSLLGE